MRVIGIRDRLHTHAILDISPGGEIIVTTTTTKIPDLTRLE